MSFISYLLNGISLGSVYAIIALGYTMVYGIAKMLNFAHYEVDLDSYEENYPGAADYYVTNFAFLIIGVLICTLLGVLVERIAYKPLREAPSLAVLITAIGVSYFLQNVALLIFGANAKTFESIVPFKTINLVNGKLIISGETITSIFTGIIIVAVLTAFINKTKQNFNYMFALDFTLFSYIEANINNTIAITFEIIQSLNAPFQLYLSITKPVPIDDNVAPK